jgi:hypothetical protein
VQSNECEGVAGAWALSAADVPRLAALVLSMAEEIERLNACALISTKALELSDESELLLRRLPPGEAGTVAEQALRYMEALTAARDAVLAKVERMAPIVDAVKGWAETDGGTSEEGFAAATLIEAFAEYNDATGVGEPR